MGLIGVGASEVSGKGEASDDSVPEMAVPVPTVHAHGRVSETPDEEPLAHTSIPPTRRQWARGGVRVGHGWFDPWA